MLAKSWQRPIAKINAGHDALAQETVMIHRSDESTDILPVMTVVIGETEKRGGCFTTVKKDTSGDR
jgi:hypothetical protein